MAPAPQQLEADTQPAGHGGGSRKWVDLIRNSSKPSSGFQLRKWREEERGIDKDELRNLGFCLVAYILGKFPGSLAVENIRKSWNVESSCSFHDKGWLIFRFHNEEDRDSVLLKGPYETLGAPWFMKKLPPYFKFTEAFFYSVPTWIRMHGLPLECWTQNVLGKLASFVGDPIAADVCTATMSRTAFARILVEVDVTQPLVRQISTFLPDGSTLVQDVTYEREPQICSKCRRIGHTEVNCRLKSRFSKPQNTLPQSSAQSLRTEHSPLMQRSGATGREANQVGTQRRTTSSGVAVEHTYKSSLAGKIVQLNSLEAEGHQGHADGICKQALGSQSQILLSPAVQVPDHELEMINQEELDAEFPPHAAEGSGMKKRQTRKASAVKLAAGPSKQLQHKPLPQGHVPPEVDAAMTPDKEVHTMTLAEGTTRVLDETHVAEPVAGITCTAAEYAEFPPLAVEGVGLQKMQTRKASAVTVAAHQVAGIKSPWIMQASTVTDLLNQQLNSDGSQDVVVMVNTKQGRNGQRPGEVQGAAAGCEETLSRPAGQRQTLAEDQLPTAIQEVQKANQGVQAGGNGLKKMQTRNASAAKQAAAVADNLVLNQPSKPTQSAVTTHVNEPKQPIAATSPAQQASPAEDQADHVAAVPSSTQQASPAEDQADHVAAVPTAVPKLQKWETRTTRSGKKRR